MKGKSESFTPADTSDQSIQRSMEHRMAECARLRAAIARVHVALDQLPLEDWIENALREALGENPEGGDR